MFVVKVHCGFEEPSIVRPFAEVGLALRWIASQAWKEFDGDAERAEILEFDGMDRRAAILDARAGKGRLVQIVKRPATPEERRRSARPLP